MLYVRCLFFSPHTNTHTQIHTNKISTVCTMQDQLAAQNVSCICLAYQQQQLRCVSRTHSLPRTWAETWCWCQRSLNPAGWSPWLQRLCGHGDRQQRGDRTAGWGAAARAKWEKEECVQREREKDGERRREGCGVGSQRCGCCGCLLSNVRVCLCACVRRPRDRVCVLKRKKKRAALSLVCALCCYRAG